MKTQPLTPYLIPTDGASLIYINGLTDKLFIKTDSPLSVSEPNRLYQHLHLTNNDEIKEGDWVLHTELKTISKIESFIEENSYSKYYKTSISGRYAGVKLQKIILTTDPKLIADGVIGIDGNTKALIEADNYKKHIKSYLTKTPIKDFIEVNFLTEFCKIYNQKDTKKSDILANLEKLVGIQESGVSKSNMQKDYKLVVQQSFDWMKDVIKEQRALQPQPKEEVVIEVDIDRVWNYPANEPDSGEWIEKIKLTNGQPTLILK